MSIDYKVLGLRIRELRTRKKMTQESLADKIHTSRVFVTLVENGTKAPSIDTLIAIAAALHISMNDLLVDSLDIADAQVDTALQALLVDCSPEETAILMETMKSLHAVLKRYQIK